MNAVVDDLQDAVARAVATALRNVFIFIELEDAFEYMLILKILNFFVDFNFPTLKLQGSWELAVPSYIEGLKKALIVIQNILILQIVT